MWDNTFNMVLRIVKEWRPENDYGKEPQYTNDLIEFLRNELKREESGWGFPEQIHIVRRNSGRNHVDIEVDEKIGIELKRNLKTQSALDRLTGQISRFTKTYDYTIVVLCGETDEEKLHQLRANYRQSWGQPVVKIVTHLESCFARAG